MHACQKVKRMALWRTCSALAGLPAVASDPCKRMGPPTHCSTQADTFRQYQAECTEVVKSMLWTSWAPKSVELFNRLPPVFINGDSVGGHEQSVLPGMCAEVCNARAGSKQGGLIMMHSPVECKIAAACHHLWMPSCKTTLQLSLTLALCVFLQDAYYRAVATLQSNQLRSLLQRSLDS